MSEYDLCVITARSERLHRDHLDIARAALGAGCRMLQLRAKDLATCDLLGLGGKLRQLTRDHGALFIVNDRVDIALAVEADGVHLGDQDLPIAVARRLLGEQAIIGASVTTPEQAVAAKSHGASYLGVGPIYSTTSKLDAGGAIGCAPIEQIRDAAGLPVLAIGGITRDNVAAIIRAGADGIAVISAVSEADDMAGATSALLGAVRAARRRGPSSEERSSGACS
jgi:thiamine-phosphate pyrophosphorylase